MALLTSAEAQTLWDNRTNDCCFSYKRYNSETKDSSTFVTYLFKSCLADIFYHINSESDGISVTHSSSASTIETNVKAYLETLEKIVAPVNSDTII